MSFLNESPNSSNANNGKANNGKASSFVALALAGMALCCANALAVTLPELVEAGSKEEAKALIAQGADVNERSPDGSTALHWAVHRGDIELVELLLNREAEPLLANDFGATPMSVAAVEGDHAIIEALLDAGADVDSPNGEGQTVLMAVARTGHVDSARLLLEQGADVNATENWGGQSALMWAAAQRQPEMIHLLLEHGADVDARGRTHDWQRRVTAEPRIKVLHAGGFTPLLYAAREGCEACVKALVAGGADIDLSDPDGITPLLMALNNLHFDTAGLLVELGADVNQWDWWGRSPVYAAIDLNTLPRGARPDLPSADDLTGLDVARMLLERGANPNIRLKKQPPMRSPTGDRGYLDGSIDSYVLTTGANAIYRAVKASDDAALKLLLEYGGEFQIPNIQWGITPALAAAGLGHIYGKFSEFAPVGRFKTEQQAVETLKILIAAGADIHGHDVRGYTAAHGAAELGWAAVIVFLHESGVDINAVNNDGLSPKDVALGKGRTETATLIDRLNEG